MKISIPDALADTYQAYADQQGRSLDLVVTAQLEKFQRVVPGKAVVIVTPSDQAILEKRLGGPVTSGGDIVARVDRLASISFAGIHLDFTPGQKVELASRAARLGIAVPELVKRIVSQLESQFFTGGPIVEPSPSDAVTQ